MKQFREIKDGVNGKRINVEIPTPIGCITIELRSSNCIVASSYHINEYPSYLELPGDPETLYLASWRMVKENGVWVDWVTSNIGARYITTYHRKNSHIEYRNRPKPDVAILHSTPRETKLGVLYGVETQRKNKENALAWDALDDIIRPIVLQWLNDNPDDLKWQGLSSAEKDVSDAQTRADDQKKWLAQAQEKLDAAQARLQAAK